MVKASCMQPDTCAYKKTCVPKTLIVKATTYVHSHLHLQSFLHIFSLVIRAVKGKLATNRLWDRCYIAGLPYTSSLSTGSSLLLNIALGLKPPAKREVPQDVSASAAPRV